MHQQLNCATVGDQQDKYFNLNLKAQAKYEVAYSGGGARVDLLEEAPGARPEALPGGQRARQEAVLKPEAAVELLQALPVAAVLRATIRVEVPTVDDLQRLLSVAVTSVRHPAAGLRRDETKWEEMRVGSVSGPAGSLMNGN